MIFKDNLCGYERYTIASDSLSVSLITLGATVTSIKYKGRETVLSYPDAKGYLEGSAYIGAAIGRYANRIGSSRFTLNGSEYILPANEGKNQLHGGPNSYDKREWKAQALDDAVRFTLLSPDGDNGFPGELKAEVTYSVSGSKLRIDYGGQSSADTVYAPTTHLYFALSGGSVLEEKMQINADKYVQVAEGLIPTGELLSAEGAFDFHTMRKIEQNYDHCFVLSQAHGLTVKGGGMALDMYTDFPAVQIYTGEFLEQRFGGNGGLAIEPEFFPDSPNRPEFPSTVLRKDEIFKKYAEFVYSED